LRLYAVLRLAHGWAGYLLFATILVHVGAALMHALVRRDGVMRAMWPGRVEPSRSTAERSRPQA
ncbi:cytochrome b, partial [Pseudomonas alabamensis]|uniref:cytochrome b n=1 Tax=Pseudomonas alabamensis TaxID=3064349 RepID=UPI003F64A82F